MLAAHADAASVASEDISNALLQRRCALAPPDTVWVVAALRQGVGFQLRIFAVRIVIGVVLGSYSREDHPRLRAGGQSIDKAALYLSTAGLPEHATSPRVTMAREAFELLRLKDRAMDNTKEVLLPGSTPRMLCKIPQMLH